MPNTKSAEKRLRQNAKRRLTNQVKKSLLRTYVRKLNEAVAAGEKDVAVALLPQVFKRIDKAAKTNCIHKNTAARKKSQLSKRVHAIS